ncbi:MAG: hypothetical protein HRT37_07865 [Alteromonadaceae bacterium]|nr:hypothetical protein [Alteromonadaceae bacterium]
MSSIPYKQDDGIFSMEFILLLVLVAVFATIAIYFKKKSQLPQSRTKNDLVGLKTVQHLSRTARVYVISYQQSEFLVFESDKGVVQLNTQSVPHKDVENSSNG